MQPRPERLVRQEPVERAIGVQEAVLDGILGVLVLSGLGVAALGKKWPMTFWAAMSAVTALCLKFVGVTANPEIFLWGLGALESRSRRETRRLSMNR